MTGYKDEHGYTLKDRRNQAFREITTRIATGIPFTTSDLAAAAWSIMELVEGCGGEGYVQCFTAPTVQRWVKNGWLIGTKAGTPVTTVWVLTPAGICEASKFREAQYIENQLRGKDQSARQWFSIYGRGDVDLPEDGPPLPIWKTIAALHDALPGDTSMEDREQMLERRRPPGIPQRMWRHETRRYLDRYKMKPDGTSIAFPYGLPAPA